MVESRRLKGAAPSSSKIRKQTGKTTRLSLEAASVDSTDLSPVSEVSDGFCCADHLAKKRLSSEFAAVAKKNRDSSLSTGSQAAKTLVVDAPACSRFRSLEAEVVAEHLNNALLQVHRSSDIDHLSVKLVDSLVKTVVEEFEGFPEETDNDMLSKNVQTKTWAVTACLMLWMICTVAAVYVKCRSNIQFNGPLPT